MSDCYYEMWCKSVKHDCKVIRQFLKELSLSSLETTFVIGQLMEKLDIIDVYHSLTRKF